MEQHEVLTDWTKDIQNAGLVILHPFLLPLFENQNWCTGTLWNGAVCRNKAVLATQYLVTGKQQYEKKALTLNKMLCGFPADQPIDPATVLTKQEMNECRKLLAAAISYLKALKNYSVEALQEQFLQRAGIVSVNNGQAEVWVQKHVVDIVLHEIPWAIGIIKTPWMDHHLQCHW